jgi:hypothetical protein
VDKSAIVVPGDLPVRIAILQLPRSFIEGAAQKSSRGSEWVRSRTDFQSRAN